MSSYIRDTALAFAFGGTERYLQMTVESGPGVASPQILAPRQQFLSVSYALNGVPVGSVIPFAGTNVPDGWRLCDGSSFNAGTDGQYLALFAAIGKGYGVGDGGMLSFNLPDLRGRVVIGAGHGVGLSNRSLAEQFGKEAHSLTQAEMPEHLHSVSITTSSAGNHSHTFPIGPGDAGARDKAADGDQAATRNVSTSTAGAHTHLVSGNTGSTGAGLAHSITQPSMVLNYIIKL